MNKALLIIEITLFASISTVNGKLTQLPPFTKLTDSSLSQNNCTEHETETTIKFLNPNKARGDGGISHKMLNGVSQSVYKSLCILMTRSFDWGNFLMFGSSQIFFPSLKREINLKYLTTD